MTGKRQLARDTAVTRAPGDVDMLLSGAAMTLDDRCRRPIDASKRDLNKP